MPLLLLFCFIGFIGGICVIHLMEHIVKSYINTNYRNRSIHENTRLNRFFDLFTRA